MEKLREFWKVLSEDAGWYPTLIWKSHNLDGRLCLEVVKYYNMKTGKRITVTTRYRGEKWQVKVREGK